MKKLILIILLFVTTLSYAQSFSAGLYLVPNNLLSTANASLLGNKIKTAFSRSSVNVADGYFPMFMAVAYDEYEVITNEGIRRTYKVTGSVTCSIISALDNALLGAESFEFSGLGVSQDVARNNAIKEIKFQKESLTSIVDKIVNNSTASIEKYGNIRYREASTCKVQRDYIRAILLASDVMQGSTNYSKAQDLIKECEKLYEKDLEKKEREEKERIAEEKQQIAQDKREEKESLKEDREFEMKKMKTQYKFELEKAKIDAQANSTVVYKNIVNVVLRK